MAIVVLSGTADSLVSESSSTFRKKTSLGQRLFWLSCEKSLLWSLNIGGWPKIVGLILYLFFFWFVATAMLCCSIWKSSHQAKAFTVKTILLDWGNCTGWPTNLHILEEIYGVMSRKNWWSSRKTTCTTEQKRSAENRARRNARNVSKW